VTAGHDTILAMPIEIVFDFAAVHIVGDRAAAGDITNRPRLHRYRRAVDAVGSPRRVPAFPIVTP
jgi:alkyl sulfatase BDS1-like metallo-beta-lactamase superfamily hydrolase